jgi:hypothetical protein
MKFDFVKGTGVCYWQRLNVPYVLVYFSLKVSFMGEYHFKITVLKDINKICN